MSPLSASKVLQLQNYGIGLGERVILSSVTFAISPLGITSLLGPTGTGKSTLLRTLAGLNDANPNLRTWGEATYCGTTLGTGERPAMIMQSTQLLTANVLQNVLFDLPEKATLELAQQRALAERLLSEAGLEDLIHKLYRPVSELTFYQNRHLSIVRICACNPRLICLDETTADLAPEDTERLLRYIEKQSQHRAVLIVSHNLQQARRLGGQTVLLAGGEVQEAAATEAFFTTPQNPITQAFLKSGSCSLPAPDAKPEDLDPESPPPPPLPDAATNYVSDSFGPRGFLWLFKGQLAGTPRPGIFLDIHYDLEALQRVGIKHLISLTEPPPAEPAMEVDLLADYGIAHSHYPIPDMEAPDIETAVHLCEHIHALLDSSIPVAVHCRAGMGRTGTALASYLIWQGKDAITALETVRRIEPRWVQSDRQVKFLEVFDDHLTEACHR